MRLFTGNANPALFMDVCNSLGVKPGECEVSTFSDGEIKVYLNENVRGKDCFVVQSTSFPQNNNLMELLILIDTLKRSSAGRVTAVLPYYGYSRQDQQNRSRAPITAKLVADMITGAGADRVMTIDIHAAQSSGFFKVPVDNLYATPVLLDTIRRHFWGRNTPLAVVSPDAGGVKRARIFAKHLDASLAIVDKRREKENVAQAMNVIGQVEGRACVIVDDMADTAGTLCEAADALLKEGAISVVAAVTHPVLSGPAIERITNSSMEAVIVTDTIPLSEEGSQCQRVRVASIAPLLGEAIRRTHNEESISSLFV